ncbi:hypothetical protein [Desertivirga brevis]|uniref:hypothetical protein n=1 Tax=Desertivirga brevis TaxID=2810310 RepID=UPI001A965880|nr:hypothetical protein [Pedobacter sp. SYSU D00873]
MTAIQGKNYTLWGFGGFIVLSLFGVLLRLMSVSPIPGLNYSFILHAHSHFAFAGWIFLSVAVLIIKVISPGNMSAHYKKILALTIITAFGMLISFSFQGYKAISIAFSTLFIIVNYWFAYKVWHDKYLETSGKPVFRLLLKGALIFLCLSSLGPFTLGPLMAMGQKGTPLYNDAIYFYLHFQMNGWMTLSALAIFFNSYLKKGEGSNELLLWLKIFIWSVLPLFFLFTLWSGPSIVLRIIALAGAVTNFISWLMILRYLNKRPGKLPYLVNIALLALSLKIFFQVLVGFPDIGNWVFSNRNLIIGYIHLLALGGLMPIILNALIDSGLLPDTVGVQKTNILFVLAVVVYLVLLFMQPLLALFGILIPNFQVVLLVMAISFLLLGIVWFVLCYRSGNVDRRISGHKK